MVGKTTARIQLLLGPVAPGSVAAWIRRYLEALQTQHRSRSVRKAYRARLAHFNQWCVERGIERPDQLTHTALQRFQRHLFVYRKADGQPLAVNGQHEHLSVVQGFFRWLVRHGHLVSNPAADLELPRRTDQLRDPLTLEEVEAVLALPALDDPVGLRDRTMLELLYATGLRRTELLNLSVHDLDAARGTVHVRLGKGQRDRFVPVGERALAWVAKYQREARPALLADAREPRLFLNVDGRPLSAHSLTWRVRRYFLQAGVRKAGACHLFRHTMATAMLDNGADIRHVQEMLGHRQLTSTQRYTHVSIARLKAVHAATHPAASLARREREALEAPD
jgi:integrase/recombinase XerD